MQIDRSGSQIRTPGRSELSWSVQESIADQVVESVQVLPALSSPGTVGCDDHLSAVIRVGVVYVQLEAFPFVRLDQREQVL